MSVNNLLKVITRKQSLWDSNPRPLSRSLSAPTADFNVAAP